MIARRTCCKDSLHFGHLWLSIVQEEESNQIRQWKSNTQLTGSASPGEDHTSSRLAIVVSKVAVATTTIS